ncbi:hypothetical protein PIB30_081578 [Stylosanthes scabra]|uniref:Uncharacterized protein n=1 Tax=Stylosanthes scabra TaxID=79078 RepID=A0ABU6XS84_9FABA|nr:hypothetical protein [Stylosanthes scabra]
MYALALKGKTSLDLLTILSSSFVYKVYENPTINHALGQAEDKRGEDSRSKIEKGKGLRNTTPVRKKKRKEMVKFVKKGRKHEKGSPNGKFEEDKAREKIELKCASVDDLISKLKAFKGALHNNKSLNTHLVQDHSKWK